MSSKHDPHESKTSRWREISLVAAELPLNADGQNSVLLLGSGSSLFRLSSPARGCRPAEEVSHVAEPCVFGVELLELLAALGLLAAGEIELGALDSGPP